MSSVILHGLSVLGGGGGGGGGVQCATAPSQTAILLTAPSQGREEERLTGEGDINPMSYIKRNTIRVKERWDALK